MEEQADIVSLHKGHVLPTLGKHVLQIILWPQGLIWMSIGRAKQTRQIASLETAICAGLPADAATSRESDTCSFFARVSPSRPGYRLR